MCGLDLCCQTASTPSSQQCSTIVLEPLYVLPFFKFTASKDLCKQLGIRRLPTVQIYTEEGRCVLSSCTSCVQIESIHLASITLSRDRTGSFLRSRCIPKVRTGELHELGQPRNRFEPSKQNPIDSDELDRDSRIVRGRCPSAQSGPFLSVLDKLLYQIASIPESP